MPIDPETIRATRNKVDPESYHNEIPNQHLTEGFWQTLSVDLRNLVRKSPLFDVKTNDQVKAEQPGASDAELNETTADVPTEVAPEAAPEPVVESAPTPEPEPAPEPTPEPAPAPAEGAN